MAGLKFNGVAAAFHGLHDTTLLIERSAKLVMCIGASRLDGESASTTFYRFIETPEKPVRTTKAYIEDSSPAVKSNRFADKGNRQIIMLGVAGNHSDQMHRFGILTLCRKYVSANHLCLRQLPQLIEVQSTGKTARICNHDPKRGAFEAILTLFLLDLH
jgi:thiamine pyrophosphokinase